MRGRGLARLIEGLRNGEPVAIVIVVVVVLLVIVSIVRANRRNSD